MTLLQDFLLLLLLEYLYTLSSMLLVCVYVLQRVCALSPSVDTFPWERLLVFRVFQVVF